MLKNTYIIVLIIISLQSGINEAKLAAMPKVHATSACLGDTVNLEIEVAQSEGTVSVTWRHGADLLYQDEHYVKSEGGRKLTILDVLPPHSGLYHARVQDDKSVVNVGFTVDVKDIFMRLQVKSHVRVPFRGTVKLKVSRSNEGVLWWTHDGELVKATEYSPDNEVKKSDHYHFHGTTRNFLEISDVHPEHAGKYEAILKSGACEVRNIMQVDIGEFDTEADKFKVFTGPVVTIIAGTATIVVVVLIVVALFYVRAKLEEKQGNNNTIVSLAQHILEPIYSTIEDTKFDIKDRSCDNQDGLTDQLFHDEAPQ